MVTPETLTDEMVLELRDRLRRNLTPENLVTDMWIDHLHGSNEALHQSARVVICDAINATR